MVLPFFIEAATASRLVSTDGSWGWESLSSKDTGGVPRGDTQRDLVEVCGRDRRVGLASVGQLLHPGGLEVVPPDKFTGA